MSANQREKVNHINKVTDENGDNWTIPEDISRAFIDFYQNLFSTSRPTRVEESLKVMEVRVT